MMTPERNNDESYQDSAAYYFSKYHETKKDLDSLEAETAQIRKDFDKNAKEIKELTKERAELIRQAKKDKEITRKLQEAIHIHEAESKQNGKQAKKLEALEKTLSERDEEIKKHKATIATLEKRLKEKAKELEKAQRQVIIPAPAPPPKPSPPPPPPVVVAPPASSHVVDSGRIDELQREIDFLTDENKSKYDEIMQNKRRIFNLERDNKQLQAANDRLSRGHAHHQEPDTPPAIKETPFKRDNHHEPVRERESRDSRAAKREEAAFNGKRDREREPETRNSRDSRKRDREPEVVVKESSKSNSSKNNSSRNNKMPKKANRRSLSYFPEEDSVNDLPETLSIPDCDTDPIADEVKQESFTTADSASSDNELNEVIRGKKRKFTHKKEDLPPPSRYKDTDTEEEDDDDGDDDGDDGDGKRNGGKKSVTKAYYTAEEDRELTNIIFNGGLPPGVGNMFSNTFWKSTSDRMSDLTVIGRSWCGIKKRFVNHILREVHNCNFLYSEEHRELAHNYYRHYYKLFGDDWCHKYDEERRKHPSKFSASNYKGDN